uniref:Carbonic anhydrase n=1 Tax=Camelus bactrianus TaxID=9837 RepID=A0A9W3HET4_CAMBA|nr:carbonic anhydrase 3 [Camelus bactrianus]
MAKEWGSPSHNGPDHWHELYPIAKGDNQSPIELHTKDISHDPSLLPWTAAYDPGSAKTILNNGKTCRVVFDDTYDRSMLRGGPLTGAYRLRQFHLHWGSSDDHGSEHIVDGVKYAAELHLVHWNSKYNSFASALKKPDGVAVIGIFLKIGHEKGEFQLFLDALDKIKTKGKEAPFTNFNPSSLFPACRDYWTYQGYEPLLECALVNSDQPVELSKTGLPKGTRLNAELVKVVARLSNNRMAKLRSLYASAENEPPVPLMGNWRPPQPLKGRVVKASFK